MARPCKLQINTKGAWRDVLPFDLDEVDSEALQVAAANLVVVADPGGRIGLRISAGDSYQTALIRWDAKKGWVDA
jgi:hypothetical protein